MSQHPRRRVPAIIVAVAILALCGVAAAALLEQIIGRRSFIGWAGLASYGNHERFTGPVVLAVAATGAVLGVVLLVCALWPGRAAVVPVASEEPITAGVARARLRRELRAIASDVDGVSHAVVRLRRRTVTTRARTERTDVDTVRQVLQATMERALARAALARPGQLRVKLRRIRRTA